MVLVAAKVEEPPTFSEKYTPTPAVLLMVIFPLNEVVPK
jgi:hypothetical protein